MSAASVDRALQRRASERLARELGRACAAALTRGELTLAAQVYRGRLQATVHRCAQRPECGCAACIAQTVEHRAHPYAPGGCCYVSPADARAITASLARQNAHYRKVNR